MSHSAEQMRKKEHAMRESERHKQYSSVYGMREKPHYENARLGYHDPYADYEADERKEHGMPSEQAFKKGFNEQTYKR